ncbi:MAG TPA: hypothetical protein VF518_07100 [Polyangia bacterium]
MPLQQTIPPQRDIGVESRRLLGGAQTAERQPFGSSSMAREKTVVVVVVPDPEPENSFALKKADRSMVARNTNGIDRA